MKKFTVFNDIHIGAPYQLYDFDFDFKRNVAIDTMGVSIGDIFDLKNCKKLDVQKAMFKLNSHKLDFQGRYLSGNHEICPLELMPYLVINDVCFMHGDVLFWGLQKAYEWSNKYTPGAGALKRLFVQAIDELRLVTPAGYNDFFFANCEKYLKLSGCHTIVCGHHHPKERLDVQKSFGRIICLPRGINQVTA